MQADDLFCTFFVGNGEAAVLACDELGVQPTELLYVPKELFFDSASTTHEQAQLRYNMRERFRQDTFRRLFLERQKIIKSGKLEMLWHERETMRPNSPGVPDLSELLPRSEEEKQQQEQQQKGAESDFDTQSDDDEEKLAENFVLTTRSGRLLVTSNSHKKQAAGGDGKSPKKSLDQLPPWRRHIVEERLEKQRHQSFVKRMKAEPGSPLATTNLDRTPRPPPGTPQGSGGHHQHQLLLDPVSLKKQRDSTFVSDNKSVTKSAAKDNKLSSSGNAAPGGDKNDGKDKSEGGPDDKKRKEPEDLFPVAPGYAPICKKQTPKNLVKEAKFLEKNRIEFKKFAGDFVKAEKQECREQSNRSPFGMASNGTSNQTPQLEPTLPAIGGQTRKHVEALVRNTMIDIAESALLAQRDLEIKQEHDRQEALRASHRLATGSPTASVTSGLRSTTGVNPTTPSEWRLKAEWKQQKDEEEREYDLQRLELNEQKRMVVELKADRAISARRDRFVLNNTQTEMRQQLVSQRRQQIDRSREVKTARTLAQRDQRRMKAAMIGEQRKAVAYINRVAHEQLRSLRTKLKDSKTSMSHKKKWEVPEEVRDMLFPEDGYEDYEEEDVETGGGGAKPAGGNQMVDQY